MFSVVLYYLNIKKMIRLVRKRPSVAVRSELAVSFKACPYPLIQHHILSFKVIEKKGVAQNE